MKSKHTLQYGAVILAFALLIVSALWLPQLFFEISDAFMYGEISLMEQEKPDVLTLTTGYEESLYHRLAGFAEGLAGQRQYYVDEQPKVVTDEIRDFLYYSELRFYAEGIFEDMIMHLFSEALGFVPEDFLRKTGLELYQWNQYVIYSDDYAQGVNFILWCFGLENSMGDNMTILMDAHDYTVYAIQITGGTQRSALDVGALDFNVAEYYGLNAAVAEIENPVYREALYTQPYTWMTFGIYYDIFSPEVLDDYLQNVAYIRKTWNQERAITGDVLQQPARIAGVLQDTVGNEVEIYLDLDTNSNSNSNFPVPYGADGESWYGRETDGMLYYDLPFQGNKITFDTYSFGEVYDAGINLNVIMGIREIYELIPEFQQSEQVGS